MDAEYVSHDDDGIGILVTDQNDLEHQIEVSWDGDIPYHGTDDYPLKPEDRTEEEQRIMSQVEERARYAAQQEFPDADILDPMWDIHHIERGIEALSKYPLDAFHDDFRDFYDALIEPAAFIAVPDEEFRNESLVFYKAFTITPDNRVDEIDDVAIAYTHTSGEDRSVGPVRDFTNDSLIVCALPEMEFPDDFDFHEQFPEMILEHLGAQIRDLYWHMGEEPPDQYKIRGFGKLNIHGDGVGET